MIASLMDHIRTLYWPTIQVAWPSLLTAFALALTGGVVGVFVVLRREGLLVLAMPQIVTLGAAIGLRLGWPTLGSAGATVLAALGLLAWSRRRDAEVLFLPALYVAGVCGSILLVAGAGAHLIEVQNLFTGIDVAVDDRQAWITSALLLAIGTSCLVLWRRWLLLAQAPAVAELAGVSPRRWNALFLMLLAAVLLLATHAVGTVMVIAMLFLPAATALPWSRRLPGALCTSVAIAIVTVFTGFVLSVELDWPLSHSIGGAGFVLFGVSHVVSQLVG
jgi:ABC-type Mn2+/Zn2+ transport system permease subunit